MSRALYSAATGMHAQQLKIDVIANNLANVNTDGYKQSRAEFQDLIYQNLKLAGAASSQSTAAPVGLQVRLPTGEVAYTRNGTLKIDDRGRLTTTQGYLLEPPITLPTDTNPDKLTIAPDGTVTAKSTEDRRDIELGRLRLVRLLNQGSLEAMGSNLFRSTGDQRAVLEGYPAEEGFGSIQQGYLEASNVKVVEEMIAMITGQRAYEANSKVIQTADRMLEEANRLR